MLKGGPGYMYMYLQIYIYIYISFLTKEGHIRLTGVRKGTENWA